jgi:hypothetical protein
MRLVVPISGTGTKFLNIHVEYQPKRLSSCRLLLNSLGHTKFRG